MQITDTMDLNQLPELIALRFNHQQMTALRQLLNKTRYVSLDEVPEAVWLSVLERVKTQFQAPV